MEAPQIRVKTKVNPVKTKKINDSIQNAKAEIRAKDDEINIIKDMIRGC